MATCRARDKFPTLIKAFLDIETPRGERQRLNFVSAPFQFASLRRCPGPVFHQHPARRSPIDGAQIRPNAVVAHFLEGQVGKRKGSSKIKDERRTLLRSRADFRNSKEPSPSRISSRDRHFPPTSQQNPKIFSLIRPPKNTLQQSISGKHTLFGRNTTNYRFKKVGRIEIL
ncbi:hypothetical protein BT69DRAFT_1292770 [Atractiella rhizophila]|nr:hypothetical protein BT69DRAFT_1292770 [Atractiella rhizophila]